MSTSSDRPGGKRHEEKPDFEEESQSPSIQNWKEEDDFELPIEEDSVDFDGDSASDENAVLIENNTQMWKRVLHKYIWMAGKIMLGTASMFITAEALHGVATCYLNNKGWLTNFVESMRDVNHVLGLSSVVVVQMLGLGIICYRDGDPLRSVLIRIPFASMSILAGMWLTRWLFL